ncbi:MAG: translation initiation factor IF-2 subunit gamma [Candidatus Hodarchaeota archaeon]
MSIDLTDIGGIGKTTAEKMKAAGIDSIEKLANVKLDDLINLKIKGLGEATAKKYIESAKELLQEVKPQEQPESKPESKFKGEPKITPTSKDKLSNIKELVKQQAECNIGLVGHVDHGKTTLVKALTGDWTDRHSEEQERGISIKLGYSNASILYCSKCDEYTTSYLAEKVREKGEPRFLCPQCKGKLEFKRNISFVDAPGHEILMATMLSGASLMDGACLLIAADEKCPQPQTREHLEALHIAGIEKIIIVQNKIDAVSREQVIKNYQEIKKFIKGTIAEKAPIIPISAVFGANINLVLKAFQDIIPSPELTDGDFQFLIARSFDINRPGKDINSLQGGVIGGSVLKGKINVGDQIEIRPGLRVKDKYTPLKSTVVSISQGNNLLDNAKPGGLIGLGTRLDPALTKGDHLIGHLVGKPDTLPDVLDEIELKVTLLDRVIGVEQMLRVHSIKHNEKLLLVVGTEKTGGTVIKLLKNSVILKLNPPICPPENFVYAISRIINRRYRLIGYGETVNNN